MPDGGDAVRAAIRSHDGWVVIAEEDKGAALGVDHLGYGGVHFDLVVHAPELADLVSGPLFCEVQVHTAAQSLWATTSHPLLYKPSTELPVEHQRALHRLSSLAEIFDAELLRARGAAVSISSNADTVTAHALARICRYNGHVEGFLSVAEHSLDVVERLRDMGAPVEVQAQGLLHDAAEAYLGDMVGPLKHHPAMQEFRDAEKRVEAAIAARFGLPEQLDPRVKEADVASGVHERSHLRQRASGASIDEVEARFRTVASKLGLS